MSAWDTEQGVRREVAAEHRQLEALFEELRRALRGADGEPSREILAQLGEALEAHFDREGCLYYPSIWALQPQRKAALSALVEAHGDLLELLEGVRAGLAANDSERAQGALAELWNGFHEHEQAEEHLLESIDRDLDAGAPDS